MEAANEMPSGGVDHRGTSGMNIELPELEELSTKLDRVLELLEGIAGVEGESVADESNGPAGRANRRFMTVAELAQYLGISKAYVYKKSLERSIPLVKMGTRLLLTGTRSTAESARSVGLRTTLVSKADKSTHAKHIGCLSCSRRIWELQLACPHRPMPAGNLG